MEVAEVETNDTVEAWREVHSTLLAAVQTAQEAVAILKVQRRYLLEEIAWNLDDSGHLASHSSWKRPVAGVSPEKAESTVKRKSAGQTGKRKKISLPLTEKSGSSTQKEPKKRKKSETEPPRKKATKIILKRTKLPMTAQQQNSDELDGSDDHHESEREQEIASLPHRSSHSFSDVGSRVQVPSYLELCNADTPPSINLEESSTYLPPSSFVASTETMVQDDDAATPSLRATHHQPTPIRNYTSLQDIAMNDESDEDRF